MPILHGTNRYQINFSTLEDQVGPNSEARLIDAFVDYLEVDKLDFIIKGQSLEGRSAYAVESLLKLYCYGYLNRTRSSRRLAKLCKVNLEVKWLLGDLRPCFQTIATFRKDNAKGLKKVFGQFTCFLRGQRLDGESVFSKDTVATDGTKISGQNSNKNNYTPKKIERHLNYIDKKAEQYLADLEASDALEDEEQVSEVYLDVASKLDELAQRQTKYEELSGQLEVAHEQGETQVSTTDPDARSFAQPRKAAVVGLSLIHISEPTRP